MSGYKRLFSGLLAAVMLVGTLPASAFAAGRESKYQAPTHDTVIGDIAAGRYSSALNDGERLEGSPIDTTEFIKISHPYTPGSSMKFDPTKNAAYRAEHQKEIFTDGVLDYIGNGKMGVPGVDPGANGQGDRGQGYCWSALADGDWMYTCLLYNSAGSTSDVMEEPLNPQNLDLMYGGDYWIREDDYQIPYSAVVKINVKTGEVVHLMSEGKNGINAQFRGAVKYKGKLYFCGSVNHLPSIYEIDPKTDAFQCVHQDEEMKNHPGGWQGAWLESRGKGICPTIRGMTTFTNPADGEEYLVISSVGMDGNPYIAVSSDPSSGEFHKIAYTYADGYDIKYNPDAGPSDLFGYAACDLRDSIMGGSIWEMASIGNKLYVAICTGKPSNSKWHYRDSNNPDDVTGEFMTNQIIDSMQSFAIVVGEYNEEAGSPEERGAWEWHSLAGDKKFGSKYPYGIDPERTRSGACNLTVFDGKLYIGEYNDTQIAFKNMANGEYTFLRRNIEQSVSLYRLDPATETFEKVMGQPTKMFPTALSGINESGFGKGENQYFWRSIVFDGNSDGKDELYYGTFDETFVLQPIARMASQAQGQMKESLDQQVLSIREAVSDENVSLLSGDELAAVQGASGSFDEMKSAGVFRPTADEEAAAQGVLLPESVVEAGPLVKVNSVRDLCLAILSINELLQNYTLDLTVPETLVNVVRILDLQEEISSYLDSHADRIPSVLRDAADLVTAAEDKPDSHTEEPPYDPEGPGMSQNNEDLKGVLLHLAGSVAGFDMFRSDDGVHFTQITRNGLGDPYNQGLRAFAVNNDPSNAWLCLGTANPFFGAQIWRMQSGVTNNKTVDPAQEIVQLNFVDKDGAPIQRKTADDHKAREVYVPAGTDTLQLAPISRLVLDSYAIAEGVTSVEIQTDKQGKKFVNIPLVSIDTVVDVTLNFVPVTGEEPIRKVVSLSAARTSLQAGELIDYLAEATDKWLLENDHAGVTIKNGQVTAKVVNCETMYTMKLIDGVLSDNRSSEKKYAPGQIISIRNTNKDSQMVFERWDVKGNLDPHEVRKAVTSFVMPASDVTLTPVYRKLELRSVSVKNGVALLGRQQGGLVVPALDERGREIPVAKAYQGQPIVIRTDPAQDAPKKRQVFVNWTNDVQQGGVILDDAKDTQTFFTMPDKAVKLTANYQNQHKVEVKGGTGRTADSDFAGTVYAYPGQGVSLKADVPEGKRFYRWEFSPIDAEDLTILDPTQAETSFVMPKFEITGAFAAQTLTATARLLDEGQYLITLNKVYGPISGSTTLSTKDSIVPDLPVLEREGWYFTGWYTAEQDGEQVRSGDKVDRDMTLYAHWSKDKPVDPPYEHTITFDANGGRTDATTARTIDGKLAVLPGAIREGYAFEGWYTQAEAGEKVTMDTVFKNDATLYAHWTFLSDEIFTIRVKDSDHGSVALSVSEALAGSEITVTWTSEEGYKLGLLAVRDKNGFAQPIDRSDKVITFRTPVSDLEVSAVFVKDSGSKFEDVLNTDWYLDSVNWGVENGVTTGTTATTFSPFLTCNRAQAMTMLWTAMGSPDPETAENPFTDVSEDDWYYKPVMWAVENGVTSGTTPTTFGSFDPCNRAQIVTFVWRAMGSPETDVGNPFRDVSEREFYYNAVMWAVKYGVTSGSSATTFSPTAPCVRAQILTMLYRNVLNL